MKTKMVLVLKARNEREARNFALVRQIPVTDICDMGFEQFRARTNLDNALKVQKWYNEEGECLPGLGYPLGSLLYFNFGV